jgi:glycosyltransferase involved in cell wall biosynthesis
MGLIVESLEDTIRAVERVSELSRLRCRQVFEERFSVARMARDYLAVYEGLRQPEAQAAALA